MDMKKSGPNLYEVLRETMKRQERLNVKVDPAMNPAITIEDPPVALVPPPVPSGVEETEPPAPAVTGIAEAPASIYAEPVAPSAPPEPEPEPAAVPMAVAAPIEEPEPEAPVAPPPPTVSIVPAAPRKPWWGLGERTVEMSYNTVAFGSLILLAALLAAYSAGLNRGRRDAEAVAPSPAEVRTVEPPAPPPVPAPVRPLPPPPAPRPSWRILVYVFRNDAGDPSASLRRQLERAGLGHVESVEETLPTSGLRVRALYCGRFADKTSPEAQTTLRKLKEMRYGAVRLADHVRFVPVP